MERRRTAKSVQQAVAKEQTAVEQTVNVEQETRPCAHTATATVDSKTTPAHRSRLKREAAKGPSSPGNVGSLHSRQARTRGEKLSNSCPQDREKQSKRQKPARGKEASMAPPIRSPEAAAGQQIAIGSGKHVMGKDKKRKQPTRAMRKQPSGQSSRLQDMSGGPVDKTEDNPSPSAKAGQTCSSSAFDASRPASAAPQQVQVARVKAMRSVIC